ncbi:MAG: hypothetical protein HYW77_01805 [Parcubacteria group bacterium]|nr:hypothetical protein [Parcubacteria group bacterium]
MSNEIFSGNLTGFTFFILIILVGIGVAVIPPSTPPELPSEEPGIPVPTSSSVPSFEPSPTTPISFWQKDYIYFLGDAIATVNVASKSQESLSPAPTPSQ